MSGSPPKRWWRRGLANFGLFLASVLVFEALLQVTSRLVPAVELHTRPDIPRRVVDPDVGTRGNPDYPGFDARGYRNAEALETAAIVALGDSQTYGTGVGPRESWPFILGERLTRTVYNMGFGGYGAVHNRLHLGEALDLKPDVVIFALYFGNDFFDDFRLALKRGELEGVIGAQRFAEVSKLQTAQPLANKMARLFRRGRKAKSENTLLAWLRRTSRVHGLITNIVRQIKRLGKVEGIDALLSFQYSRRKAALEGERAKMASAFEDDKWRTILTSPYRYQAMDDSEPRLRAGVEATKHSIKEMAARVTVAGARFLVIMIPTKENVFRARVRDVDAHVALDALATTESRLGTEIKRFMADHAIAHLDLLPVLRGSAEQPYFVTADGHPNRHGQRVIAEAVADILVAQGFGGAHGSGGK